MRLGVIGLGSMGKRRVRDLTSLGHEVIGLDIRSDRRAAASEGFGIRCVETFADLKSTGVSAVTVSTPPDQHVEFFERCFDARIPFFSEANVLVPSAAWFRERETASGVRTYPSATWQFYPLFGVLKEQLAGLAAGAVQTVHYHYGGYLPFWHPWEKYDEFYAGSRKPVAAAREMVPFEMEWMRWVFGPVQAVSGVFGRRGEWRTDIDDTYLLTLEFESGLLATLMSEIHQVAPFRIGRIACRDRSFTLDMSAHELRRYDLASDSWKILKAPGLRSLGSFDFEQTYLAEMRAFVDALEGRREFPKTWSDERHLSDVLYAAEESHRRRAWVTVADVQSSYDGILRFGGSAPETTRPRGHEVKS